MAYHDQRDELGRWAPAASSNAGGASFSESTGERPPNGGGVPSFSGEGFEHPTTDQALRKYQTSPLTSSAPSTEYKMPDPIPSMVDMYGSAESQLAEATPGHQPADWEGLHQKLEDHGVIGQPEDDEFAAAHRAAGYGPAEGPALPDISQRFGTQVPPPSTAVPPHPFSRDAFHSMANGDGGQDWGGVPSGV